MAKTEDIALLLLVGLAFIGRGPFATPGAGTPDVTGRMGVDTSRPSGDTSGRGTIDPSTGKPNNDNSEVPDMSGANTRSAPPVDPYTGGNAGDKAPPVTMPYDQSGSLPPGFMISQNVLNKANLLRESEGISPLYPSGSGGLLSGVMDFLGGIGKQIIGMVAPLGPILSGPKLLPEVFATSGGAPPMTNPEQQAAQDKSKMLIATRPDLTYSTGFAGGIQGPSHIGGQFTRNSSQEQVAIKDEKQRALALSVALGYTTGNMLADPTSAIYGTKEGYGYFDKITGKWI
jgi:hypothetical protein